MPINNFHPYQKDQNILSWDSKMTDCSLPHYWHTGTVQYSTDCLTTDTQAQRRRSRHCSVPGQPPASCIPPPPTLSPSCSWSSSRGSRPCPRPSHSPPRWRSAGRSLRSAWRRCRSVWASSPRSSHRSKERERVMYRPDCGGERERIMSQQRPINGGK